MTYQLVKADYESAHIIHNLVHQIYFPTYREILSIEQIDFMLAKSYTLVALKESMEADQDFYLLKDKDNHYLGFIALKAASEDILRIEKLYLLPETQGKGLGKLLISKAQEIAQSSGKHILELNVNRSNKAYYFYLKQGFNVIQEVDIPYFGYILDDYIMQKEL